jgi:LysR family transcriptional regulator, glycine cleavage system transcriptional activator
MWKYRLPVLNSLRAFEAAARHQSFREAGKELHVDEASISRHIRSLERWIGRELFERHARKIVLTHDGKELLAALSTSFSIMQGAITGMSTSPHPERLAISVDPDFASLWLVPKLAEFCAIAPNALIEILAEVSTAASLDPRMDCGIHYAEAGLKFENSEVLFRSSLFPVYAPDLLKGPPLRTPADLRHHAFLHDRTRLEWQEFTQSCGIEADANIGSGSIFSETAHCLDAAVRGQGVAMGDDFLAALYLSEGRLVRPFEHSFLSKNAYYFIAPHGVAKHTVLETFRNWLFEGIDRLRNITATKAKE